ncbi:MAG: L-aspartate oxidase [Patescibacteria group bacterium]
MGQVGFKTKIVVIGSGIAGLNFALGAAQRGIPVLLITKKQLTSSATNFAQGGIAAVLEKTDSFKQHVTDTMEAGAYHNNKRAVEYMVRRGPSAIRRLMECGVSFSSKEGHLMLTREGGHRARRVAFVGDYTGKEIERTLVQKTRAHSLITIWENSFGIDLVIEKKRCIGISVFHDGKVVDVLAGLTVLSTGGLGQIYEHTTNPAISTGDGIAMAYRAGARFLDLEFIQFHPTALNIPKTQMFLISEAVRGEGGVLRNSKGKRFMVTRHELAELAPRDLVARAIFEESSSGPVYLDVRHMNPHEMKIRFPQIYQKLRENGINPTHDMIPITPVAHYSCGGVAVNLNGETTIKNLLAFGEVAGTGVHGANRLASNSLLEAVVFSDAALDLVANRKIKIPNRTKKTNIPAYKSLTPAERRNISVVRRKLKIIMWNKVGIYRTTECLKKAIEELKELGRNLDQYSFFNPHLQETRNMIQAGLLVALAAYKRKKSLGCHSVDPASRDMASSKRSFCELK